MSKCLCLAGIFCIEKAAVICMNGNLIVQICHCNPVVPGASQVSAGWPVCLRGWASRVTATLGHLLFLPPRPNPDPSGMAAPCILLDCMSGGRGYLGLL